MKAHRSKIAMLSALLAMTLAVGAQFTAAQPAPTPPASAADNRGTAAEGPPILAPAGHNGDRVMRFRQIVGNISEGQIVNPLPGFPITRLAATFMTVTGGLCTATLIGPRVLLTAAHCISTSPPGVPQPLVQGTVLTANGATRRNIRSCRMAPGYSGFSGLSTDGQNDFALCELDGDIGVQAERIDMDAATVLVRARILTAGFGCTNSDIDASNSVIDRWTGRNIPLSARTLRVGENVIKELSPIGNLRIEGRIGGLGAIVCPGDSGGPVFRPLSAPGANQQLSLVAVNSSVQSATVPHDGRYLSNLAPLSDPDFRNFLNSWIAARPGTRQICGRQLPGATAWCR